MNKPKILFTISIVGAFIAVICSIFALVKARQAQQIALSEIVVEERNSLITPVYDEKEGAWSYLAIFELGVSNVSGPPIELEKIRKMDSQAGFIIPLKGSDYVDADLQEKAFVLDAGIGDIRQEPEQLKSIIDQDMGPETAPNIVLDRGESKTLRLGLSLKPYDSARQRTADMVLVSFQLLFSNGKSYVFRRGFPVASLVQE